MSPLDQRVLHCSTVLNKEFSVSAISTEQQFFGDKLESKNVATEEFLEPGPETKTKFFYLKSSVLG